MGAWAEFEEKEFETLANVSLVTEQFSRPRGVQVFSPGQVLEKTLGFDFASHVDQHSPLHRRLFGSAPGAPGATPSQLAQLRMPIAPSTRLLNVFFQYKRPEHFKTGHRSTLWPKNEEFLRFTVSENHLSGGGYHFAQIRALDALNSSLGTSALVRYVCPTAWTKSELYGRFSANQLLSNSVFVDPKHLLLNGGGDPYHRRWTFQRSLPDAGKPNPNGPLIVAEGGEAFMHRAEAAAGNAPRSDQYSREIVGEAHAAEGVRGLVDARKARLRVRDRAQADIEDKILEQEIKRVPTREQSPVRASLKLAKIARDLGLQWSIVAFA